MNAPESRALAPVESNQAVDLFTAAGFQLAQRVASAFANSNAVPAQFRLKIEKKGRNGSTWEDNPAAIGNCIVAIETARAVGMSITSVMQQANVIEGKLSWSAQFIIAAINASQRFTPLQFEFENRGLIKASYKEKQGWNDQKRGFDFIERTVEVEDVTCYAWAFAKQGSAVTTRKIVGPKVSMKMAVEEGWYGKAGSKWQGEMAQLMLTYRAGSFFGRIHAPDVVMGMGQSAEERIDTLDLTPTGEVELPVGPFSPPAKGAPARQRDDSGVVDAEYVDPVVDKGPPELVPAAGKTVAAPEADRGPKGDNPERTRAEVEQIIEAASAPVRAMEEAIAADKTNDGWGEVSADPGAAEQPRGEPADAAEKQHLKARVARAGLDMAALMEAAGVKGVRPETLDGLSKDDFKAIKRKLL